MRTGNLKIYNTWFIIQFFVEQASGIFDEFGKCSIHFRERLLILALNHHLRLSFKRRKADLLDLLNGDMLTFLDFNAHAGSTALRVRDTINVSAFTGMLRKL